ncbi:MAG TPA: glycosyltransferase family 2 protein [Ramlibacter sp.]|nr:glycosyltransferase family 2 protein [Ramlibacter sp.]
MLDRFRSLKTFLPVEQGRIYVLCNGGLTSGGPELLHQLVGALVARGREAYIAYVPFASDWQTPAEYRRYGCPVAETVPDEPDVAVVVPEVGTAFLSGFRRAHHVIWWLSVDYYRGSFDKDRTGPQMYWHRLLKSDIPSPRQSTHLFQSGYARAFVRGRFSVEGAMLSDYLADEYLAQPRAGFREPWVAYNPRKGLVFTKRLIAASADMKFVALENMTRDELRQTLAKCSAYIDFGAHPGKDRIPREAAMCGAVVVVARRGSARFFEDVPLDEVYKVDGEPSSLAPLRGLLQDILRNFQHHHARQAPYRQTIAAERALFERQVDHVFAIAPSRRQERPGDAGRVLAVVVTYHPDASLQRNLAALRAQVAEVVVVDNASANIADVAAAAAAVGCRLVCNEVNVGIARGFNQGIAIAMAEGYDWVATFDQDSLLPAGAIQGLLDMYYSHPKSLDIGAIVPAHRDRNTGRDYYMPKDILQDAGDWRLLRTTISSGALVPASIYRRVGVMDESLFIDFVDHDFFLRCRMQGLLVVEASRQVMEHSLGNAVEKKLSRVRLTLSNHSAMRRYYMTRNQLEVYVRYLRADPFWAVRGLFFLGVSSALVLVFEANRIANFRAMLKGAAHFATRRFGARH